jgi:hypothetical protein
MEILVDRKLILSKFLIPLNKFTDQAIIYLDKDYIDCVSYTTSDKQSIILYTKLFIKNDIQDPTFKGIKLNIGSVKKLINAFNCINDDIIRLNIEKNSISYTSPDANFKFHLKEDGVIETAPITVEKIARIGFKTEITLSPDKLEEIIRASSFSTDSNKIYLNIKNNTLYADLTDKTIQNLDSISILLTSDIQGEPLTEPVPLRLDVFRILSSIKFEKLNMKFNKDGVVVFEIVENNYLMKYITSSLIK